MFQMKRTAFLVLLLTFVNRNETFVCNLFPVAMVDTLGLDCPLIIENDAAKVGKRWSESLISWFTFC